MKRQIFIDTETTGFDFKIGNRVIEFGAIEMINRKLTGNVCHFYFKPDCEIEDGALQVHGITLDFLADKPLFEDKIGEIIEFVKGAEIIIHNVPFDVPFINNEIKITGSYKKWGNFEDNVSKLVDSLVLAKEKYPMQRNNLNALCKRFFISNEHRTYHGALLDANLLAEVYLAMTGGQESFTLEMDSEKKEDSTTLISADKINLRDLSIENTQNNEHEYYLKNIVKTEVW